MERKPLADFQCPACLQLQGLLEKRQAKHPGDLAISYQYLPLPYHRRAAAAARAAECAADQGRFEPFHAHYSRILMHSTPSPFRDWRFTARRQIMRRAVWALLLVSGVLWADAEAQMPGAVLIVGIGDAARVPFFLTLS